MLQDGPMRSLEVDKCPYEALVDNWSASPRWFWASMVAGALLQEEHGTTWAMDFPIGSKEESIKLSTSSRGKTMNAVRVACITGSKGRPANLAQ